jgi:enamine deaminase RidA (YjgF/YER057c/UK114 family)
MLTPINPETLAPPIGFSHAMVASADSKIVFLAGQTALNQQNVMAMELLSNLKWHLPIF